MTGNRKKIKILRIFSRLNIGGPAIHTILLTAGLNNNGFESVLVKGSEDSFEGSMMDYALEKGIEPIVIPEMGKTISLKEDLKALLKIYRLIVKENPHIVHTHTAKAGTLGRGAAVLVNLRSSLVKGFKKKFLFNRFTTWDYQSKIILVHTFHGHVFYGYFNRFISTIFIRIESFLALFTNKIITLSKKQREEIIGFHIGDRNKVVLLPLGLELKKFLSIDQYKDRLRRELGAPYNTRLVAIVARLVPVKNHKMFIDAVEMLRSDSSIQEVKFLIIGDGELRIELERYVYNKGLCDDILFLGFRKDMEKIYSGLDIVVLTSLNEGSPVALIESMAAELPFIATNVGGVADLVDSEDERVNMRELQYRVTDCGILIESGDIKGLAIAMRKLLQDDDLRRRMGMNGRKKVYPKYDVSRLLIDMEKFYNNLVS